MSRTCSTTCARTTATTNNPAYPLHNIIKSLSRKAQALFAIYRKNPYLCLVQIIEQNIDQIVALCKKYKVAKLWVFGSILTPRFNEDSDIDFSVIFHYDKIQDLFVTFFDFIEEMEILLGRKVDLIDETAIKNLYFRKELDKTKYQIYG